MPSANRTNRTTKAGLTLSLPRIEKRARSVAGNVRLPKPTSVAIASVSESLLTMILHGASERCSKEKRTVLQRDDIAYGLSKHRALLNTETKLHILGVVGTPHISAAIINAGGKRKKKPTRKTK